MSQAATSMSEEPGLKRSGLLHYLPTTAIYLNLSNKSFLLQLICQEIELLHILLVKQVFTLFDWSKKNP